MILRLSPCYRRFFGRRKTESPRSPLAFGRRAKTNDQGTVPIVVPWISLAPERRAGSVSSLALDLRMGWFFSHCGNGNGLVCSRTAGNPSRFSSSHRSLSKKRPLASREWRWLRPRVSVAATTPIRTMAATLPLRSVHPAKGLFRRGGSQPQPLLSCAGNPRTTHAIGLPVLGRSRTS